MFERLPLTFMPKRPFYFWTVYETQTKTSYTEIRTYPTSDNTPACGSQGTSGVHPRVFYGDMDLGLPIGR